MKHLACAALLVAGVAFAEEPAAEPVVAEQGAAEASPSDSWTVEQKVVGGAGFQSPGQLPPDIDVKLYLQGLQDAVNGTTPVVDGPAFQEAIQAYQAKQQAAEAARRDQAMAEQQVRAAKMPPKVLNISLLRPRKTAFRLLNRAFSMKY